MLARFVWGIVALIPVAAGLGGLACIVMADYLLGWQILAIGICGGLALAFLAFLIVDIPPTRAVGALFLGCAVDVGVVVWEFGFAVRFQGGFEGFNPGEACRQAFGVTEFRWSYVPPGLWCGDQYLPLRGLLETSVTALGLLAIVLLWVVAAGRAWASRAATPPRR